MQTEQGKLPPPPGLIASLASGFDAVATHILVIALPVLLDLFLWLGPHLRLLPLAPVLTDELPPVSTTLLGQILSMTGMGADQQNWDNFLGRFNLFNFLQTLPVGISGLLGGLQMPTHTPFGGAGALDIDSIFTMTGLCVLLAVTGWLLGTLYYHWVSRVSLKLGPRSLSESIKQTVFLSATWIMLLMVLGIPALILVGILTYLSPVLGVIAQFILSMIVIWLVVPIFFSPHGIFIYQQDAFHSILNSLRMVRFTLPNTGLFLMAFLLISQGMDFLWRTPPDSSWLTLVGIAGHAFVSTALLAASFIYYRDINAWLQVIFEQLKAQATSARV